MWMLSLLNKEKESRKPEVMHALERLGFGAFFLAQLSDVDEAHWSVGRVAAWDGAFGEVISNGTHPAELSGKLRRELDGPLVTGDWVLGDVVDDRMVIRRRLERRTALIRRIAGATSLPQVVVANVDVLLIVTSANSDMNERRLERYLAAAWDSGARPIVVVNKADLVPDVSEWTSRVTEVAAGAPVIAVSAHSGVGLDALAVFAQPGTTLALVGSSGVGKSSIINAWLGSPLQHTGALDHVERGRHTTTRRALLSLPSGAMLIDTPGMREFGLIESGSGLDCAFEDVSRLASRCRFADCSHDGEPGCAVSQAVAAGELPPSRLASYLKLQREAVAMQARTDQRLALQRKRDYRARTRASRQRYALGHKGR